MRRRVAEASGRAEQASCPPSGGGSRGGHLQGIGNRFHQSDPESVSPVSLAGGCNTQVPAY